jgi:hypothetical protein
LRFNSSPREGIQLFSKGEILGDLAIAKHETIRKTSANPVSRVLQANLNMEIHKDFVPIRQKFLGLAGSLGPCPASFGNVLLDFRDTTIGTGCRKALGLDAHNLRVKIRCYAVHVIAIDCGEKLFQYFSFGVHRSPAEAMQVARPNKSPPGGSI